MVKEHVDLEYNSRREHLIIAEYGRHVQKMIQYAKTIESKEIRQAFVEGVIELMYQMNPNQRNSQEVMDKLWKHAYRISGFDLDVDPPSGIVLTKPRYEDSLPEKLSYPQQVRKYRHYGGYIQQMIERANHIEDPVKQKEFYDIIGSYLKLAYRTWNKEHYINDEVIKTDIVELSEGKITDPNQINYELMNPQSTKQERVSQHASSRTNKPPLKKRKKRKK